MAGTGLRWWQEEEPQTRLALAVGGPDLTTEAAEGLESSEEATEVHDVGEDLEVEARRRAALEQAIAAQTVVLYTDPDRTYRSAIFHVVQGVVTCAFGTWWSTHQALMARTSGVGIGLTTLSWFCAAVCFASLCMTPFLIRRRLREAREAKPMLELRPDGIRILATHTTLSWILWRYVGDIRLRRAPDRVTGRDLVIEIENLDEILSRLPDDRARKRYREGLDTAYSFTGRWSWKAYPPIVAVADLHLPRDLDAVVKQIEEYRRTRATEAVGTN